MEKSCGTPGNAMDINNLSFCFNKVEILKEISFSVKAGEIVVIIGPSGCGKTTLMDILSGHRRFLDGSITVNGQIRSIYQQDNLYPWLTVSQNISLGSRYITNGIKQKEKVEEMLSLTHLTEHKDKYPHELSGGLKQKVAFARALTGDAEILLMDEPFSALDYLTRLKLRQDFRTLLDQKPMTVLMITHDIEDAVLIADRIIVLTKRPAQICEEIPIFKTHPRVLDNELNSTIQRIIEALHVFNQ